MVEVKYVLMGKGTKNKVKIAGKIYDLKDDWKVPYYSSVKKEIDETEELALNKIREKLKRKWLGFRILETTTK